MFTILSYAASWSPAAGNCFQKHRYPAVRNFDQFFRNSSINSQDIRFEISSDCKYCLGLKVEATVALGHGVKSQCFRHLRNIQHSNYHRNYQQNLTRVFSVCSEMPSDSK